MQQTYPLIPTGEEFATYIARHSGDQTIAYTTVGDEDIYLSYYYPKQITQSAYPTIIMVHGGGWGSHKIFPDQGNLWQGDYLGYLARYYADRGYVCVSIDYRLSREDGQCPNYQLIDCYDDCAKAVDYILANAAEHYVDTKQVSLLGESAGGHLAGMLATVYRREEFYFHSAFLVNPVLDFENCSVWISRIPKKATHSALKAMTFEERANYLSPNSHIHPAMCPVVLIHGKEDTTVGSFHSLNFYQKMLDMQLDCDLHLIEGTSHAFLLAEYTSNAAANQIGIAILNTYLLK